MKEIIEKIDNMIAYWKTDVHEFPWGKELSQEAESKIDMLEEIKKLIIAEQERIIQQALEKRIQSYLCGDGYVVSIKDLEKIVKDEA